MVNGDPVELFFSPSDGTTQAIIETIETADASVDFSTLVFTRDDIAESIIQMNYDFFVTVSGIIEQINVTGSEYQVLVDEGVNVLSYQDLPGQLHHKLVIVDHASLDDDPLVLTGSHNWSSAAETSNDENILIIHNADIANQYYQEYSARYNELTVGINDVGEQIHMVIYPNPAKDKIAFIASDFSGDCDVIIYDASGKLIQTARLNTQLGEEKSIDISSFNTGIYQLTIRTQTGQTNLKFIKN
jgi:phosphatidylserine/phosphatidylglycerophosphate/cardiolipin synthase-like enzyme